MNNFQFVGFGIKNAALYKFGDINSKRCSTSNGLHLFVCLFSQHCRIKRT